MYIYIYNQSKYFEPETSSGMSELRERIYIYIDILVGHRVAPVEHSI